MPKKVIGSIIIFIIIYFDPIYFGPIKWAQLWKLIFIGFALFVIFSSKISTPAILKLYYLIVIKMFINTSTITYPFEAVGVGFRFLFFPVFLHLIYCLQLRKQDYNRYMIWFSFFLSYSCILFHADILQPLVKGYNIEIFGEIDVEGFVGLFATSHGASIALSFALMAILFNLQQFGKFFRIERKLYYLFHACVLVYSIYQTYVRTALLMLAVGLFLLFIYKQKTNILKYAIPVVLIVFSYFVYQFFNDEVYRNRLIAKNIYDNDDITINKVSSGRFDIWNASFNSWTQNNEIFEILFGIGEPELKERNGKQINMKVFSHNGFIDMLVQSGIIGFVLYIFFFIKLYKISKAAFKESKGGRLIMTFFFMFLGMMFVQSGELIYNGILYAFCLMSYATISYNTHPVKKLSKISNNSFKSQQTR